MRQMEKKDAMSLEQLDFISPKFNPLAVLNAEDLVPPCPEISGFNTLREYEIVVREKHLPSSTFLAFPTKEQDDETSKVKSSSTIRIEFLEGENQKFYVTIDSILDAFIVPVRCGCSSLTMLVKMLPHLYV